MSPSNLFAFYLTIFWTLVALIAIVPFAIYGLIEAVKDMKAVHTKANLLGMKPDRDALTASWWYISIALLFVIIGLTDVSVGFVALTNPPREISVVYVNILSYYFNAITFVSQEIVAVIALHYGLYLRRVLGTRRKVRVGKKIRITQDRRRNGDQRDG